MTARRSLRDLVFALQGHVFGHAVGDEPDLGSLTDARFEALRAEIVVANLDHHPAEDADLHQALFEVMREVFVDHEGNDRPRRHIPDYDHFCFLAGRVRAALDGRKLPAWTPEYLVRDRILRSDEAPETPAKELSAIEKFLRQNPSRPDDGLRAETWDAAKARHDEIVETTLRACFRPAPADAPSL